MKAPWKAAKIWAAALGGVIVLGFAPASAQWTFVGPSTVYTTVTNYQVGIGTTVPRDPLHIHELGGSTTPRPGLRISCALDACDATGRMGIAQANYALARGSRAGDLVIAKLYGQDHSGACGDNVFVTTHSPNGSIILATADINADAYPRVAVGQVNGHTYMDVKGPKVPEHYANNNAMLRFYSGHSTGGATEGLSIHGPWLMGSDGSHGIAGVSAEPVFRIGLDNRLTQYPGTPGGPSGLFTDGANAKPYLTILRTGQVLIGDPLLSNTFTTTNDLFYNDPSTGLGAKLSVDGKIVAHEFWCIGSTNWADFVFADDYKLASLEEVEQHIKEKKHLPDIPSAQDVADKGVHVVEMQVKLLQKVEELTLYVIEQQKQIRELQTQLNDGR